MEMSSLNHTKPCQITESHIIEVALYIIIMMFFCYFICVYFVLFFIFKNAHCCFLVGLYCITIIMIVSS